MNIDNVIAKRNINRYFEDTSGEYELDIEYLGTLGIDAAGEIKRLENEENKMIRKQVEFYLNQVESEVKDINFQNFNINRLLVKRMLEE